MLLRLVLWVMRKLAWVASPSVSVTMVKGAELLAAGPACSRIDRTVIGYCAS